MLKMTGIKKYPYKARLSFRKATKKAINNPEVERFVGFPHNYDVVVINYLKKLYGKWFIVNNDLDSE